MENFKTWLGFGPADPNKPIIIPDPEHKIPYELKTWITFKCFDACIGEFSDKNLISSERYCLKECSEHLKNTAVAYQSTQEFKGFNKQQKQPFLNGLGKTNTGVTKFNQI